MHTSPELQRRHHQKGAQQSSPVISILTMLLLIVIAVYFLFPLYWLFVSTLKSTNQLFSTPMLAPPANLQLGVNLKLLATYQNGVFGRWALNSAGYSLVTAAVGTCICTMSGYTLAKYRFRWNRPIYGFILLSLMIPGAAMVIPTFLLVKFFGLINTYPGVILPMLVNPFGVYFMTVYAREAMPDELIDSGRVDGASDYRIFSQIAVPIMMPGFITLFLISFVGTWNNFFLPLVLLSKSELYPLTVGLQIWTANISAAGTGEPLYPLIMLGSFLSIVPMLILFPILRKYIIAGITLGGIKS